MALSTRRGRPHESERRLRLAHRDCIRDKVPLQRPAHIVETADLEGLPRTDARNRTGDPFITSGLCRALSYLRASRFRQRTLGELRIAEFGTRFGTRFRRPTDPAASLWWRIDPTLPDRPSKTLRAGSSNFQSTSGASRSSTIIPSSSACTPRSWRRCRRPTTPSPTRSLGVDVSIGEDSGPVAGCSRS